MDMKMNNEAKEPTTSDLLGEALGLIAEGLTPQQAVDAMTAQGKKIGWMPMGPPWLTGERGVA
jgi:hypothetical protein